jgi:murein DD-endopeptidase MepM/ murein hydrolase activator NlpD
MPVGIKELKPKKKMPLPKPKPRHANPKHPMNTERTGPLRKAGGGSMKIKSGDTLSQIAKKNNISLRDLLSANPSIKNANQIRVGQSIKLPSTKMVGSSIGATRNPYKNMSKKDMADMDVKNKSAKRQQAVTKRSRVSALDDLKAKAKSPAAKAKKAATTKASSTQVEVGKGTPAMNKAASLKNVTSKENRRLDEYREKMKRMSGHRKGGGQMKKVSGYKSGGMVRGAGAATKGKRFGRCG